MVAPSRGRFGAAGDVTTTQDRLISAGLVVVAFAVYWNGAARFPTEWDGAQLVMGLDVFDVSNGTPHAPGYWLYIAAGRALEALTPLGGTASMTLLAALAAAASVGLTFRLGVAMGDRLMGGAAAALMISSPFLLFYGMSVDTYTFDALACVVLMSLAWHARPGTSHGVLAAFVLGVSAGLRQTSLLLFAPLVVLALARSARSGRTWLLGAAAGAAAIAIWLIPMLAEQPGGFRVWRRESNGILEGSLLQTVTGFGDPVASAYNLRHAAAYAAVALLPAAVVLVVGLGLRGIRGLSSLPREPGTTRFAVGVTLLGALPSLGFLALAHFGKAGYLLGPLPAVGLFCASWLVGLSGPRRVLAVVAVTVVAATSAQRFAVGEGVLPLRLVSSSGPFIFDRAYGAPFDLTLESVNRSDEAAADYLQLSEVFDPGQDVLTYVWLNGHQRFRSAMLTMPHFTVAMLRDDQHLHTGRDLRWISPRDSRLEVPPGGSAVFVLESPPPEVVELVERGKAEAVRLESGRTVWVVQPEDGVTLFGVRVVEGDPFDAPGSASAG